MQDIGAFYRAMDFSAKRGIGIASFACHVVRLSVRLSLDLSVRNVGGSGP